MQRCPGPKQFIPLQVRIHSHIHLQIHAQGATLNVRINSHLRGLRHARRQQRRYFLVTITDLFQHLDAVFA